MRIAWITNHDAPYRRPLWAEIARSARLAVLLLNVDVSRDPGSNRGADWDSAAGRPRYTVRTLATLRMRHREARYYFGVGRLRLRGADVVLLGGWESPVYWQAALSAWALRVPKVGFYESHAGSFGTSGGVIGALRSWWFRHLDAVVVPGSASRDAVRAMGVSPARIFTGFNAVDVARLHGQTRDERLESDAHRFIFIGQLIPRKNLEALLSAFALCRHPGDTLTVVGVGPLEGHLRARTAEFGMQDEVTFAGYVPGYQLHTLLATNDTLVMPSTIEVWGLVVNEALAAGLHAVVSETAGVAPSVASMRGVWVSPTNPVALAEAMSMSRASFAGAIAEPEILKYTPERFAGVFLEAFRYAAGARTSRSA